jgi:saccharopine dehydrogenase-like NADP-dependent oxidoreductase
MKNILILGAGLSSSSMISYLLGQSARNEWKIAVGDVSVEVVRKKIEGHNDARGFKFDVSDGKLLKEEVKKADVVISMLPARFHPIVAAECLAQSKHMVTASYISPEMKAMDADAKKKNILFLNEIGVDPGIDHMSAMKVIHEIQALGGKMISFESSTGGLVAPESDNNPWNYKFSWNPRNVVLAGQGVSKILQKGQYKYIPYNKLYSRIDRTSVPGYGDFEIYPNRDSLQYREIYGLSDIQTMFRGTMRRPGYCKGWDVFVQLGMTDDTYILEGTEKMTWREFINTFLAYDEKLSVEEKVCNYCGIAIDSETMQRLKWLGIFTNNIIGLKAATPAQVLQKLLEEKWALGPNDKDLIVMQHRFIYQLEGKEKCKTSTLVVIGQDQVHTAMAITVGMPMAIAVKMLMLGQIKVRGVRMPIITELYQPILKELEEYGVKFLEEDVY